MDILLQMKAYSAVDELYTYGKHVRGANWASVSIAQLATTKHRNVVPEFDKYVRYYETESFADDIIRAAIDSIYLDFKDNWTDGQRRMVILKASQVLVMYFAALQYAYEAVADCRVATQSSNPSDSWDRAAAILIGSLEGTEENGTSEGYMVYDLAQEYCSEFGTCSGDATSAKLNEDIVSLLYTGRGAVLTDSCRALEKAADELSVLLLIPVIQGALSSSLVLSTNDDLELRAEAYVYGRALVPFVRNRNAANDIDSYLTNPGPSDKRHTAQKVYAALATAYPNMNVDCEDIGTSSGIDTCEGVVYVTDYIWYVVGAVAALLIVICGLYYRSRKRRSAAKPENNPRFVASRGEMNHEANNAHSMDLLEKAFKSRTHNTTDSSHSDDSGEAELLNKKFLDDRAEELEIDEFDDEDDDVLNEAIALTKRGRREKMSDII